MSLVKLAFTGILTPPGSKLDKTNKFINNGGVVGALGNKVKDKIYKPETK